jgi:hypothetical protein
VLDASVHGFGAHFRRKPDDEPEEMVSTPPQHWNWSEQVYREGSAYAVATAARAPLCRGRVMIVISDCDPVVHSAARGSRGSEILHHAAQHAALAAVENDCDLACMWAPGQRMVDWGVDGLSRTTAHSLHDAMVGHVVWKHATRLAADLGGFSVDWFADAAAHQLPRYWARYADGGAEGVNALLAPSWCQNMCVCGHMHREVGWFFPPIPLVGPMMAKAKREGACGVAILPMQIGEPWWPLVEEAAISTWKIEGLETPFINATPAYCAKSFSWLLCSFAFGTAASPISPCDRWACEQVKHRHPVTTHATASLIAVELSLATLARDRLPEREVDAFGKLVEQA